VRGDTEIVLCRGFKSLMLVDIDLLGSMSSVVGVAGCMSVKGSTTGFSKSGCT